MNFIIMSLLTIGAWAAPAAGDAAAGKTLFLAKCATCHAKDAKGSAGMAKLLRTEPAKLNLTGPDAQKMSAEELEKVITTGRNKMPAFKDKLKPAEIDNLAAYIKSLGGATAASPKGR